MGGEPAGPPPASEISHNSPATAQSARSSPTSPAASVSVRLSVSSWRRIAARLAPMAVRTAISRSRAAARAMSRLARFAHAISSTRPTIAISTPQRLAPEHAQHVDAFRGRLQVHGTAGIVGQLAGSIVRMRGGSRSGRLGTGRARRPAPSRSTRRGLSRANTFSQRPLTSFEASNARADLLLHRERNVELRHLPALNAQEPAVENADHRHRMAVYQNAAVEDLGIGSEMALPVAIAEHDNRVGARRRVVRAQDRPAHPRADSQHFEEVPRDGSTFAAAAPAGSITVAEAPARAITPSNTWVWSRNSLYIG